MSPLCPTHQRPFFDQLHDVQAAVDEANATLPDGRTVSEPDALIIPLDHPYCVKGTHDELLQARLRDANGLCAAMGPASPSRSMMCTKPLGHHVTDDTHAALDLGDPEHPPAEPFVLGEWPVNPDPATLPRSKPKPLPASDNAEDVPVLPVETPEAIE